MSWSNRDSVVACGADGGVKMPPDDYVVVAREADANGSAGDEQQPP